MQQNHILNFDVAVFLVTSQSRPSRYYSTR